MRSATRPCSQGAGRCAKDHQEMEDSVREAELAEKRRVAPGWLDRDEKILKPVKAAKQAPQPDLLDAHISDGQTDKVLLWLLQYRQTEKGELDRAFGWAEHD